MEGDEDVRTRYGADATQLRGDDRPDLPSLMFAATLNEMVHERPLVAAVDAKERLAERFAHIRNSLTERHYRSNMATLAGNVEEVYELIDAALEKARNAAAVSMLPSIEEDPLSLYEIFHAPEYKAFVAAELATPGHVDRDLSRELAAAAPGAAERDQEDPEARAFELETRMRELNSTSLPATQKRVVRFLVKTDAKVTSFTIGARPPPVSQTPVADVAGAGLLIWRRAMAAKTQALVTVFRRL